MKDPNGDIIGGTGARSAHAEYRALDYWIRTYCTPGKPGPGVAEYENASGMAALSDLKRLFRFGAVVDFAELSATYWKVTGSYEKKPKRR